MLSYTARPEPSPLSIWMEQIAPCAGELAWCHSTDVFRLQKIIRRGELRSPTPCNVFGEPLSYFCYGRPAYKQACSTSIRTMGCAPVVILMSSELLRWRKRVFPFDSGAFVHGRYSAWLHKSMELHEFDITRLPDCARRFLPSFYATHLDYLTLQPRRPTIPYDDFYQVEALVAMLTDTDASKADDRRFIVELQVEQPIPFEWPFVRGLILPQKLRATSYVSAFLKGPGRGVKVRYFHCSANKVALEYQGLLEHFALELQQEWRML